MAEGALIRVIVPGIAIISAAGWDYLSTKAIGQVLQARIRRRGLAAKRVDKLSLEGVDNPKLILQAVLCLALTKDELSETEIIFYSKFVEKLRKICDPESIAAFGETLSFDWDELVTDLADVTNPQEKSVIYNALTEVAIVDGQLQRKKIKRLESVANLYGLPFDLNKLKTQAAVFKEPHRSRTCLIVMLIVLIFSCFGCSFIVWSTLLQKGTGVG